MGAIVFASAGGRKYHFDKGCKAFEFGQQLNDWDTPDDAYLASWNYPSLHALVRMSATKAAMDGKLPCLACVPEHLREMPDTEDFGHEPVQHDREFFGEMSDDPPVCARCSRTIRGWFPVVIDQELSGRVITQDQYISYEIAVLWPCTSAVVLGLAPRTEAA